MKDNFKIIMLVVATLLICVVVYFFIMPTLAEIEILNQKISEARAEKELITERINIIQSLGMDYKKYQEEIRKLNEIISPQKEVHTLLVDFDYLTSVNGLILKTISANRFSASKTLTSAELEQGLEADSSLSLASRKKMGGVDIILDLAGSYSAVKNFLQALEKDPRFFEPQGLSLSPVEEGGEFSIGLQLKTYILE